MLGHQDETAHRFVNAPALLPLLSICSNSSVEIQHSMLLAICLWLRRSDHSSHHIMLTRQFGWQLPVCNMLNGSRGPDRTSHALCLQLLSEHVVASLLTDDDGLAEVVRTVAFLEMHTVEPIQIKRALFSSALDLLRGAIVLPSAKDSPEMRALCARVWGQVLQFCLIVEDSFIRMDEPAIAVQLSLRGPSTSNSFKYFGRSTARSEGSSTSSTKTTTTLTHLISPSHILADGLSSPQQEESSSTSDPRSNEAPSNEEADEGLLQSPERPPDGEGTPVGWLYRDANGNWIDFELCIKILQVLDPLIVRAIVEPAASTLLHVPAARLKENEKTERKILFLSIFR